MVTPLRSCVMRTGQRSLTGDSTLLRNLQHHLDAHRRIEAVGQFLPWAAHLPRLEPKVSGSGSQRVPLLTIMNASGGVDAVINGRLDSVWRSRSRKREGWVAWAESLDELSGECA